MIIFNKFNKMEAIDKLYETIMENENNPTKKDSKSKKTSTIDVHSVNGKNCCKAAVRYTTIGNAYRNMMKQNTEVWLIDEDNDGNTKTHAFSRCLKTISDENGYCHIHSNTIKNNGQSKVKDFEKDILPINSSDKTRRLANEDDKYFLPMGKRGAKKKNSINTYTFQDESHPILLVLNHKNAKLNTLLTIYATQLLKTSKENVTMEINKLSSSSMTSKSSSLKHDNFKNTHNDSHKKITKSIDTFDNLTSNKLLEMMSELTKNNDYVSSKNDNYHKKQTESKKVIKTSIKKVNKEENYHTQNDELSDIEFDEENSSFDEVNDKDVELNSDDESVQEKDDNSEAEESDAEGSEAEESVAESVECVPIKTKDDEELWYNPNENIVYRMSGEDGEGVELGYLKKVHKSHHYIYFEKRYYTVVKQICNNYECIFSKNIFDEDMNII